MIIQSSGGLVERHISNGEEKMNSIAVQPISIIIPIYNLEKYIEKCIDSILKQTYTKTEIIIIDDGSTDGSEEICNKYAKTDERVIYIKKENGGPSSARNKGIEEANGEYLFFVDGDDYLAPETIEKMLERILTDHSKLALCGFTRVGRDNTILKTIEATNEVITGFEALKMAYREDNGVLFCSTIVNKLYHRSLFHSIRFPEGKFHEDEATVYKILDQCDKISLLAEPFYYYLDRENSTMNLPYSVKQLDGIEASYQRYFYYKKKGGKYRQLLIPEGNEFAPLYFRSKQNFKPISEKEKERVKEVDKMAREICFDHFLAWSVPRRIKLLSPELYMKLGRDKKKIKRIANKMPKDLVQAARDFPNNQRQFGFPLALCRFSNSFSEGHSDIYIRSFSSFMIQELHEIIDRYNRGQIPIFKEKCSFNGQTPVWTCWWQGEREMPPMVKACINRNTKVLQSQDIVFQIVTEDNVKKYIDFPTYIEKKYQKGLISKAWYSDVLRWGLLTTYGGLWLDTTFYLTKDSCDEYKDLLQSPFYTQRFGKIEDAVHEPSRGKWCNGFLAGKKRSIVFSFVYEALLHFWEKYDYPSDYIFLDYIIWAGYVCVPAIRSLIDQVPVNNTDFWGMVDKMNEPYEEIQFQKWMNTESLYKFPYRGKLLTYTEDGDITNYGYILQANDVKLNH